MIDLDIGKTVVCPHIGCMPACILLPLIYLARTTGIPSSCVNVTGMSIWANTSMSASMLCQAT